MTKALQPAVFFDRDGTLIEEVGYLDHIDRIVLFPWTIDALRVLRRAGFRLFVITNQAGIARGYFDEAFVESVHAHLGERFAAAGVPVDHFYYCPHHPEATRPDYRMVCRCRKPGPGMIERAAVDFDVDLSRSFVVGDRWLDIGAAHAAGARGLLVRTGYGAHESRHPEGEVEPAAIVDHVFAAASWIVREGARPPAPAV
ncbi:MAG: D-glycero-alpha-D-manno-heptose-1,7-bisphosphate 7-phosphatase [Vicinamibacterales bacterium]